MKISVFYFGLLLLFLSSCNGIQNRAFEKKLCRQPLEVPQRNNAGNEIIIKHLAYQVSYNVHTKNPNWVAYELSASETEGDFVRTNFFQADPQITLELSATNEDYRGNKLKMDRGHMAPAADMKWSEQAMMESFYYTNICPQSSSLNRGRWNDLEELVRMWAKAYGRVYVVCGPMFSEKYRTIGSGVAVPESFYKALLVKNSSTWQTIAFVMPNKLLKKNVSDFAISVDSLENLTQLNFFAALPNNIENKIEANYAIENWAGLSK